MEHKVLIDNWKAVLKKGYSVRWMILAAACSGAEVVVPFFNGRLPLGMFAALSLVSTVAAFVTRFIAQKELYACPPSTQTNGPPATPKAD